MHKCEIAARTEQTAPAGKKAPLHRLSGPSFTLPILGSLSYMLQCLLWLQDALGRDHEEGPEGEDSHSLDSSSAGGDDDFDQYLRELNAGEPKHEDDTHHAKGSDDECSTPDLDDYVKDLQAD